MEEGEKRIDGRDSFENPADAGFNRSNRREIERWNFLCRVSHAAGQLVVASKRMKIIRRPNLDGCP